MKDRDIDILAISGIDRDLVLKVPYIPGNDEKVRGEFVGWLSGGPVANMACAASQLDLNVHAVCQVGDDGGEQILRDYEDQGVNTELCRVVPGAVTPFTVILIPPNGEKVIIVFSLPPQEFDWDSLEAVMARTKVVFMLPHSPSFRELAALARSQGALVMTDIEEKGERDGEGLEALLGQVDIASFNQFGVRSWTGREPSPQLARELLGHGPRTVLFTLGAAGSMGADADSEVRIGGHQVEVVDSTGAGDTFHGAFLSEYLVDGQLQSAMRFANAAGALSVTGLGPRGKLPKRAEVQAMMSSHGG